MNANVRAGAALLALVAATAGCASGGFRRVDDTELQATAEVDLAELKEAAEQMVASLLATDILATAKNAPATVALTPIKNRTHSHFNAQDIVFRMRERLVNANIARVITVDEDAVAKQWAEYDDALRRKARDAEEVELFKQGKKAPPQDISSLRPPDFSLSGQIDALSRSAGKVRQVTYTFRLTLTRLPEGEEAWTATRDFSKAGSKASVGF